jgi:DNA segregation ATPase FtsK/SpoIIIE, S-DNA-T family
MVKKRRGRLRKRTISKDVVRPRSRRTVSNKDNNLFSSISPETKKGIFVFVLLIVGFLSFLALFDLSGAMGEFMVKIMGWMFGWLYFLIPFIFIILGFLFLNSRKYIIRTRHYMGLVLFLLSSSGLMNLIIGFSEIFEKIKLGKGGGYFGLVFYWPFFKLAGFWGALVLLLGILIVSILLIFELSVHDLNIFNKLRELISLKRDRIDEDEYIDQDDVYEEEDFENIIDESDREAIDDDVSKNISDNNELVKDFQKKEHKKKVYKKIIIPIELLDNNGSQAVACDIEASKIRIKKTLAHFGIEVEMGEVNVGPTITQFTLKPKEGIKLSKIMALQSNLAMSLAAKNVRIEAPIPGKALVGIEVPNKTVSTVKLKEIINDKKFREAELGSLKFAAGKDVSGRNVFVNLAKLPHLLIAGTTGSGKSVAIDSLVISLLYRLSPNEIKFIFVDPKRVGLSPYNGIPHLLTPVITKVDKTVNALKWLIEQMDQRYELLLKANKKDIDSYNKAVKKIENKMYKIILVIDELADLMISSSKMEVESSIVRLAQMSRAVGIHLVLATQRPSVQVVTGLIKANIDSRIALRVPSQIDSRTMIDMAGAEKLLGKGDMLFTTAEIAKPKRLQGAFVSEEEKERVIDFLKKQDEPDYVEEVTEAPSQGIPGFMGMNGKVDSLLSQAREVVMQSDKASATLLQRRLSVGYARAAKILDQLEDAGIVGPANGPKPREVLIREGEDILDSPVIETDEDGLNEELEEEADEILENNNVIEEGDEEKEPSEFIQDEIIEPEEEKKESSLIETTEKESLDSNQDDEIAFEEELNESDDDIEFEIEEEK